jgi:hypothetical protein
MEPFFIAQTGETKTADERHMWVRARMAEAKSEGAHHGRMSFDDVSNLLLVECWKEPPMRDGKLDEGKPRWQIAAPMGRQDKANLAAKS